MPEERHGRLHAVDANVHEAAAREPGVKDVEALARPQARDARRDLGEAHLGETHVPKLRKRLRNSTESWRVDGSHCLHGNNALLGSCVKHAFGFPDVGGEALLDQHVLASAHEGKSLRGVCGIGGADVDSIDVGAGTQLVEGIEGKLSPMLVRKRTGTRDVARIGPRVGSALKAGKRIEKALGYPACANGSWDAPFACHHSARSHRIRQRDTHLIQEILDQRRPVVGGGAMRS